MGAHALSLSPVGCHRRVSLYLRFVSSSLHYSLIPLSCSSSPRFRISLHLSSSGSPYSFFFVSLYLSISSYSSLSHLAIFSSSSLLSLSLPLSLLSARAGSMRMSSQSPTLMPATFASEHLLRKPRERNRDRHRLDVMARDDWDRERASRGKRDRPLKL